MIKILVNVNGQFMESKFLGETKQIDGVQYYKVLTPLGWTYVSKSKIYLKVEGKENGFININDIDSIFNKTNKIYN